MDSKGCYHPDWFAGPAMPEDLFQDTKVEDEDNSVDDCVCKCA